MRSIPIADLFPYSDLFCRSVGDIYIYYIRSAFTFSSRVLVILLYYLQNEIKEDQFETGRVAKDKGSPRKEAAISQEKQQPLATAAEAAAPTSTQSHNWWQSDKIFDSKDRRLSKEGGGPTSGVRPRSFEAAVTSPPRRERRKSGRRSLETWSLAAPAKSESQRSC